MLLIATFNKNQSLMSALLNAGGGGGGRGGGGSWGGKPEKRSGEVNERARRGSPRWPQGAEIGKNIYLI